MSGMARICRLLCGCVVLVALVGFTCSQAFCWGSATHAYIDDQVGKSRKQVNLNEIYGGMAPDVFVYLFDYPQFMGYLYEVSHENYESVWKTARSQVGKAAAYGFVSHNGLWGADYTAHTQCLTCNEADGYVVAKAKVMLSMFPSIGLDDAVMLEVCHNFVEWAVDILMTSSDPSFKLARKVEASARFRTPEFPRNLVRAYAADFSRDQGISYQEAVSIIRAAEGQFRDFMILYGKALQNPPEQAVDSLSQLMAGLAEAFLASMGVTLPDEVNIVELVKSGIGLGIMLCRDDLPGEILATTGFVESGLSANSIDY